MRDGSVSRETGCRIELFLTGAWEIFLVIILGPVCRVSNQGIANHMPAGTLVPSKGLMLCIYP